MVWDQNWSRKEEMTPEITSRKGVTILGGKQPKLGLWVAGIRIEPNCRQIRKTQSAASQRTAGKREDHHPSCSLDTPVNSLVASLEVSGPHGHKTELFFKNS
jgi:hypothetical protein